MTTGAQQSTRLLPQKRSAATMLFTAPDGRVLVVKPTYKPHWELSGGGVEDGEPPGAAATGEVAEELGIDRPAGALGFRFSGRLAQGPAVRLADAATR